MNGLNRAEIEVDRKVLADIAVHDPESVRPPRRSIESEPATYVCAISDRPENKTYRASHERDGRLEYSAL